MKWHSWMFYCLRSVKFSILINMCPKGFFRSSRGLRQGDPPSPQLFIMVLEVLSKMIRKTESGFILGFVMGEGAYRVSHLYFANDTIIFCDANESQIGYLRCILHCFEAMSGLKINLTKSEMFRLGEVPNIGNLAWILDCKISLLPLIYLGLPLMVKFKSRVA